MDWIIANYIEVLGFVFGVAYVILASKQSIWCWPIGIVNVIMYVIVFYQSGLYGEAALNLMYFFISVYGLYAWLRKKNSKTIGVSRIAKKNIIILAVISLLLTLIFGFVLDNYTDSTVPYLDGLTSAFGIVGTYMTARKYIENWILWIVNDAICIGLFIYKGLHLTSVYYFIMIIFAFIGYYSWKKDISSE